MRSSPLAKLRAKRRELRLGLLEHLVSACGAVPVLGRSRAGFLHNQACLTLTDVVFLVVPTLAKPPRGSDLKAQQHAPTRGQR